MHEQHYRAAAQNDAGTTFKDRYGQRKFSTNRLLGPVSEIPAGAWPAFRQATLLS